jgi:hypothetical protein
MNLMFIPTNRTLVDKTIGGGHPVSINQMIAEISRQTDFKFIFKNSKRYINDVDSTCADSTYLQSLIQQKLETDITQGLSEAWVQGVSATFEETLLVQNPTRGVPLTAHLNIEQRALRSPLEPKLGGL